MGLDADVLVYETGPRVIFIQYKSKETPQLIGLQSKFGYNQFHAMLSLWANWLVTKFGLNSLKRFTCMTCTVIMYMSRLNMPSYILLKYMQDSLSCIPIHPTSVIA